MALKNKKRVRRFVMPEIVLTPLVDTALTLVVILMVAAPMVQNGIKLSLPQGQNKDAASQQELVVSITKDEKLFFNSYPVEKSELVLTVKEALKSREDCPVYVRGDESLAYGKIMRVVDDLKVYGVKYVIMSTRSIT